MPEKSVSHDFDQATQWRLGEGAIACKRLNDALKAHPFDQIEADSALGNLKARWPKGIYGEGGWARAPWANVRGVDVGQASNEHVNKNALSHPMVATCRWGSLEALEWLCTVPEVSPVVEYDHVADFWSFNRAAQSGISGAFKPLWNKAKTDGWSQERLGEAISSWLMGAGNGEPSKVASCIGEARGAFEEMCRVDPGFILPMSPVSVFSSALSSAVCRTRGDMEIHDCSRLIELLAFAPASRWMHESLCPDSEMWKDEPKRDPALSLCYVEDALSVGNHQAVDILLSAGFNMPTRERAMAVLSGEPRDEGQSKALAILQERWAREEAAEIEKEMAFVKKLPASRWAL